MHKFCVVLGVALSIVPAFSAQEKSDDTSYFPLKVGTKWHYKQGDSKLLIRVAKHDTVEGKTLATLEYVKDGQVLSTEQARLGDDGVFRHKALDEKVEPPLCILKLPAKKGDSWPIEVKIKSTTLKGNFTVTEEEITVPAGKYRTLVAKATDLQADQQKVTLTYYFAPGVGIVKQVLATAGTETVRELEKYEPTK